MHYRKKEPGKRPLRHVQVVRRRLVDGRDRLHSYFRPLRIKLPGEPHSPEFMAVYLECERRLRAASTELRQPVGNKNLHHDHGAAPQHSRRVFIDGSTCRVSEDGCLQPDDL